MPPRCTMQSWLRRALAGHSGICQRLADAGLRGAGWGEQANNGGGLRAHGCRRIVPHIPNLTRRREKRRAVSPYERLFLPIPCQGIREFAGYLQQSLLPA